MLALAALDASAQRFPGRERNGSPRDAPQRDAAQRGGAGAAADPFSLLEREMPSLKVDILLKPGQVPAWQQFERDIRDLAEMNRQRQRFLMKLRDPGEEPLPGAGELLARLADEDRRKADATADLKRHFDALYAMLDDAQRRTIDRRLVLSQTEPLGQEIPPKR